MDCQEYSPTPQFKNINSLVLSFLSGPNLTSIHDYWKNIALTRWTFVTKVMFLLFNMLSSLVIAFLSRSKRLNFMATVTTVITESQKIKSVTVSVGSPSICHHEIKKRLLLGRKAMTNLKASLMAQ